MRLEYYRDPAGNFGDDLNAWLWPRLRSDLLDDDPSEVFVGMGTLLGNWFIRKLPGGAHKHVFGSGAGYGTLPTLGPDWTIHCVRGPRTVKALGLASDMAVTDPGAMVGRVALPPARAGKKVAFMPHHKSAKRAPWAAYCRAFGLRYIDPRWDAERVLAEIRGCDLLGAEAMHGAIIADALRVPWVPVFMHEQVNETKWRDWAESLNLGLRPMTWRDPLAIKGGAVRGIRGRLRAPAAIRRLAARLEAEEGQLSASVRLTKHQDELLRRLAAVRPAGR